MIKYEAVIAMFDIHMSRIGTTTFSIESENLLTDHEVMELASADLDNPRVARIEIKSLTFSYM